MGTVPKGARRLPKFVQEAIVIAVGLGWACDTTKRGHVRLRPPAGWQTERSAFVLPGTPSDHRGCLNSVADLRRAGLPVPRKGQKR